MLPLNDMSVLFTANEKLFTLRLCFVKATFPFISSKRLLSSDNFNVTFSKFTVPSHFCNIISGSVSLSEAKKSADRLTKPFTSSIPERPKMRFKEFKLIFPCAEPFHLGALKSTIDKEPLKGPVSEIKLIFSRTNSSGFSSILK